MKHFKVDEVSLVDIDRKYALVKGKIYDLDKIKILPKIGIKDVNGIDICEGDNMTLPEKGSSIFKVKYEAPSYVLADANGQTVFAGKRYFEERKILP